MLRRHPVLGVALLLVAIALGGALLWTGPGREAGSDLGLVQDPTLLATLSGPLNEARTLRDEDEAVTDVAYLTRDAALTVSIRSDDARGIQRVDIRVDGRPGPANRIGCPAGVCPQSVLLTTTPPLVAAGPGTHRVEVFARTSGSTTPVRVGGFEVRVGDPKAATGDIEPRPVARRPLSLERPRTEVDRVVLRLAGRAPLVAILGRSRLRLRERGAGSGVVTVLADIFPPRRNVTATLPQLGDDETASVHAAVLRDLLLDVDLPTGRLVGVQPGPGSVLSRWRPSSIAGAEASEDKAPSSAFTARRPPRLRALSERGPQFFVEDGTPDLAAAGRDWPVSVVFSGRATVSKVKDGLHRVGLVRRGSSRSLGYRLPGSGLLRFDADRGLKDPCDAAGTDLHVRVYAPTATDRFSDPEFGSVVLATVHLDHRDGCGIGPQLFGFSERAEARLAALLSSRLGWRVQRDALELDNAEPLRRDRVNSGHVWLSDGAATLVTVP